MGDLGEMFTEVEAEMAGEPVDLPDTEVTLDPDENPDTDVEEPVVGDDDQVDGTIEDDADDDDVDEPDEGSASFDWSAYADDLVPITVQGETLTVPLKELRDGYMRQQDYTRKTQEVSAEREAAAWARDVQQALETDPEGTILNFAKYFGLLDAADQTPVSPSFEDLDEDLRPFAEMIQQQQQTIAELQRGFQETQTQAQQREQAALVEQVKGEVRQLADRFGDEFDPETTLRVAAEYSLPLEDAHYLVASKRQAENRKTESKVADTVSNAVGRKAVSKEQQRQASKRQVVSSGTKSYKAAADVPVDEFNNIGELFAMIADND